MRLLCVADQWASTAYLKALALHWSDRPPGFDWRLSLSVPFAAELRKVSDLAERVLGEESIESWEPDALLLSAGGTAREAALRRAARQSKRPVLQFVDTWYNYRRRFTENDTLFLPDRILVIDGIASAEAESEGLPADRLQAVGHPVWESVERLPPSRSRDALFLGAPVERDYGRSLGYTESESWELFLAAARGLPGSVGTIYFAPHPDQPEAAVPAGIRTVAYDAAMLTRVATVAGMFSAPLVDAYLAGRRAITVQPNATAVDMCPLSRHGRIGRSRTVEDVTRALAMEPADPSELSRGLAGSRERITRALEAIQP